MGFATRTVQIRVIVLHVHECRVWKIAVTFTDLLKKTKKNIFLCICQLIYTALKHTQKLVLIQKAQCLVRDDPQTSCGSGHCVFKDGREHFAQHPRHKISDGLASFMVWNKML